MRVGCDPTAERAPLTHDAAGPCRSVRPLAAVSTVGTCAVPRSRPAARSARRPAPAPGPPPPRPTSSVLGSRLCREAVRPSALRRARSCPRARARLKREILAKRGHSRRRLSPFAPACCPPEEIHPTKARIANAAILSTVSTGWGSAGPPLLRVRSAGGYGPHARGQGGRAAEPRSRAAPRAGANVTAHGAPVPSRPATPLLDAPAAAARMRCLHLLTRRRASCGALTTVLPWTPHRATPSADPGHLDTSDACRCSSPTASADGAHLRLHAPPPLGRSGSPVQRPRCPTTGRASTTALCASPALEPGDRRTPRAATIVQAIPPAHVWPCRHLFRTDGRSLLVGGARPPTTRCGARARHTRPRGVVVECSSPTTSRPRPPTNMTACCLQT